jgi:cytochrome P450
MKLPRRMERTSACQPPHPPPTSLPRRVRDIETIDAELRRLVRAWRVARVLSDRIPSTELIDQLLAERAGALEREGFFHL